MKTSSEHIGEWAIKIALKTLKYAGLALGGIVAVFVIMSLTGIALPLNFLKDSIEEAAYSATGRSLSIDGRISLVPGLSPVASIWGIRFSNPPDWEDTPMVSVDQVEAEVHLLPLLKSRIHIGEIRISGVNVSLDKQADGQANWDIAPEQNTDQRITDEKAVDNPAQDGGEQGMVLHAVDSVELNDVVVSFQDRANEKTISASIKSSQFSAPENESVSIDLDGTLSSLPVQLGITGPPLSDLMKSGFPMHVDVGGVLAGINLELAVDVNSLSDIALVTHLHGKNLAESGSALGISLPDASMYDLSTLAKIQGSNVALSELSLALDQNSLGGDIAVSIAPDLTSVSGNLHITKLDVDSLLSDSPEDKIESKENQPDEASDQDQATDQGLSELGSQLESYFVDLGVKIDELSLGGARIHDSSVQVSLHDGELETPLNLNLNAIPMEGLLSLSATDSGVTAQASLQVENNDVGDLEHLIDIDGIDGSLGKLSVATSSSGDTVPEFLANLETHLVLEKANLNYGDNDGADPINFTVDNLHVAVTPEDDLTVDARGSLLGQEIEVDLDGGKLRKLVKGRDWPIHLVANGSGANLEVTGKIAKRGPDSGSQLDISFDSNRLGDLNAWTGINPEFDAGGRFSAVVSSAENGLSLTDVQLKLGASELDGSFVSSVENQARHLDIKISSSLLDTVELAGLVPVADDNPEQAPDSETQQVPVQQDKSSVRTPVVGAGTLDMPVLPKGVVLPDADLDIAISRLKLATMSLHDIHFGGSMLGGKLAPSEFGMRIGDAVFAGEISLDTVSSPPTANLKLETHDIDLGLLLSEIQVSDHITASASLFNLELDLVGKNLGKVLAQSTITVEIKGGQWQLTDLATGEDLPLVIEYGKMSMKPGEPISIVQDVLLNGEALHLGINLARPESPGTRKNVELEILVNHLDNSLVFSGASPVPLDFEKIDFSLHMQGENLGTLSPVAGIGLPDIGPYTLTGGFRMNRHGYFLDHLQAQVGSSVLNGSAEFRSSSTVPDFRVELVADKIQLNDFEPIDSGEPETKVTETDNQAIEVTEEPNLGVTEEPDPEISGEEAREPRITAKSLGRTNGIFKLNVKEIVSGEDWLGDGIVEISLQDSRLSFDPVHIGLPGGGFDASATLYPAEEGINTRIWAKIDQFDYGVLARRADPETKMSGVIYLDINLESQARNLDRIMANANGYIDFALLPEYFEAGIIDLWAASLLVAILPQIGSSPSLINCLIARFNIEDGLMKEDELYLDTSKLRAKGKGEINFKEETISYVLKPQAKNAGFFQVQAPLEIEGKFSDMAFGLQGGLIGTTLRMVATTYTVPLRILTGENIPRDGSDICVPPPPREESIKEQADSEQE